jgi:hypothetical protein
MERIVRYINDFVKSQGLALAMIISFFVWREKQNMIIQSKEDAEISSMKQELKECQSFVVELLKSRSDGFLNSIEKECNESVKEN